ncbi:protein BLISTER [Morus notabilis]|uniref:protein BLISTER n=1 Tax=Morus notabilis TaxID=981085 RepID=UPI000CED5578|nr:protein BLISTER [Morus notabilis]
MASAQVLPNTVASSRKQEHLEAGKRRLEEFRKKKAADRSKKASSTSQIHASEVNSNEKQPLETEHARVTDTNGAGTSDLLGNAVTESSSLEINNDSNPIDAIQKSESVLSSDRPTSIFSSNEYNSFSSDQTQKHANGHEFKKDGDLGSGGPLDVYQSHGEKGKSNDAENYTGDLGRLPYGTASEQFFALRSRGSKDFDSSINRLSLHRIDEPQLKEEKTPSKDYTIADASSQVSVVRISSQNSISSALQSEPSSASGSKSSSLYEDIIRPTANRRGIADDDMQNNVNFSDLMSFKTGKENISGSASGLFSMENGAIQTIGSMGFESNFRSSPNHVPLYPLTNETNSRSSRPSFLDNLNIHKASSGSHFKKDEFGKDSFKSNSLKPKSVDFLGPSPFHKPSVDAGSLGPFSKINSSTSQAFDPSINSVSDSIAGDQPKLSVNENGMEWKHEFYLPKQNEDFAALEQHIEDLTQEKFSLQRALEASRSLAESLAAENSSLTDSYNQQRGVVDQLKSDMEKLQEEIKAQLAELEAVRNEYGNAQLECNAADERAKLLASEVISLEEKALRLRSNELKLERQLENSQAEISSYKKKLSILEKDRLDLQSTIDALQEEKKLLQSKLWKASTSGRSVDLTKSSTNKKDMSTTTEDLANEDTITDTSSQETSDASVVGTDASSSPMLPLNGYSTAEASFAILPPEQSRMIQNINTLISELALEKQELIQALTSKSSHCSKLKELNTELSRKLEAQTQRLELLTAQSMANEHISARQPDSHDIRDNIPYADEGDEVVERVLGWIMKLFPGGPPRRRTSKLL